MTSISSTIQQRFGGAAALTAITALLLVIAHKSYVMNNNEQQQQTTSNKLLRSLQMQDESEEDHYFPHHHHPLNENDIIDVSNSLDSVPTTSDTKNYVFLQKFPLKNSFGMIFHTEVVVCPRKAFEKDAHFLETLDALVQVLPPSSFEDVVNKKDKKNQIHFAAVAKNQWSAQSENGCVQLGFGEKYNWNTDDNAYEFCRTACCGSPHKDENRRYALNSKQAVIENALGDEKEVYLYGVSPISGEDAYRAACHGHMNAIEEDKLPVCVSNWAGTDYNALTNNCNTYTSTVLKCVFGLSDSKPNLGVSDMVRVSCPKLQIDDNKDMHICSVPKKSGDEKNEGVTNAISVQ